MTDPGQAVPSPADLSGWPAPPAAEEWTKPAPTDPIHWGREAIVGGLVTAYSLVLGAVVGLIWPHLCPHLDITDAVNGSEAATKALLGADMWLGLLGIVAGIVASAILTVAGRDNGRGPGGILGLAVGGLLGSLVAAHVGHLVQAPHFRHDLKTAFPDLTASQVTLITGYFGFTVRMKAVLLAWPIVAVAVHAAGIGLQAWRDREPTQP